VAADARLAFLVSAICLLVLRPAAAAVTLPNLPPGSQYQIAFVTADTEPATSANIADYNAFVTSEAAPLTALLSAGVTWKAVVSTATVNANANAPWESGVPVYDTLGFAIAFGSSGLYQPELQAPINGNQFGLEETTGVYTGSDYTGTGIPNETVGGPNLATVAYGASTLTNSQWAFIATGNGTTASAIYGLSSVITVPLPGDVNHDGIVNGQDISVIASHWLNTGTGANDPPGDANGDGIVNGQDISIVASHWLQGVGGSSGGAMVLPEPSTFILAALTGLALLATGKRYAQRSRP
jgi:hypothetical protein